MKYLILVPSVLLSFFFHVQVCMPPTLCALQLRTGFLSGLSHCKYIVTFLSRDWLTPPYPTFSPILVSLFLTLSF